MLDVAMCRMPGFVLAVLLAAAAPAASATYVCSVEEVGDSGWISPELVIREDPGSGVVIISDAVLLQFAGAPATGTRISDTPARTVYGWKLSNITHAATGQKVRRFLYRATLTKGSLAVKVTGRPEGYDNSYVGRGTCRMN